MIVDIASCLVIKAKLVVMLLSVPVFSFFASIGFITQQQIDYSKQANFAPRRRKRRDAAEANK